MKHRTSRVRQGRPLDETCGQTSVARSKTGHNLGVIPAHVSLRRDEGAVSRLHNASQSLNSLFEWVFSELSLPFIQTSLKFWRCSEWGEVRVFEDGWEIAESGFDRLTQ